VHFFSKAATVAFARSASSFRIFHCEISEALVYLIYG
jgi:hypothetical protein